MLVKIQTFFTGIANASGKNATTSSTTSSLKPTSKIVIAGGGCFGISTALHLLRRGYKNVTVLERATELPAADAAGTDINKVVRSSYNDEFYTCLAREAIEAWKNHDMWGDNYHESGVLAFGLGASLSEDRSFQNDLKHAARIKRLTTLAGRSEEIDDTAKELESITLDEVFSSGIPLGSSIMHTHGYFNADGGWVYSKGAMERAMELVKKLGGRIISGKEVSSIVKVKSRTRGVKCKDGSEYSADIVVLATGSWTGSAFPELKLGRRALATGHAIVTVQLTPEEGERYRNIPVIMDLCSSGFYLFPPNEDNLIKMGGHFGGVINTTPYPDPATVGAVKANTSTPRTVLTHGVDGMKVPKLQARFLRECFRKVFPELGDRPFNATRLCWYTDSPDSNWIIDVHPEDPGLALVTAGSGHGFKFLPVIGRLVADRLEGKMNESIRKKFAVDRQLDEHMAYRDRAVIDILKADELIGPGEDC